MTLTNENSIKKYWLGVEPDENDIILIEKEKIETLDDEDYNFRLSLSRELDKTKFLEKNKLLLKSNNSNKFYRLKNRYSIKSNDGLFYRLMSGYCVSFITLLLQESFVILSFVD